MRLTNGLHASSVKPLNSLSGYYFYTNINKCYLAIPHPHIGSASCSDRFSTIKNPVGEYPHPASISTIPNK